MKMTFQRFKQIGKKTTAMILSVLIVSQFIDFSIISAGAEESGEPSVIQNEQAEPSSGEPDEPSQEESEPEEVVIGEQIEYDDLSVNNGYTLTEDKEVNNVILSGGTLDLNGHSLVVHGNVTVSYGTLYINRGYLNCLGNFSVSNYRSQLTMDNVNDKILVSGDFVWDYANSDSISNGVIEVKGDFKDNTTYNSYTFGSTGNNKVLLSGDAKQNIEQKNMHSFINILELDNHSQGGISAATPILAGTIIRNGCSINYPISGIYGYKLTQNDTIQGDVYLIGDELDLNGKTLNITGNLIQAAGKVNINGGTLNVAGDYLIESYTMDNDNNHVYDYSSGYLIMQNENDMVNVDGDFIMGSVQDHTGLLTSGVMNIKGDFEQKVFNYETNFSASGNHKVVFSGSGSQTVTFKKSTNNTSHFACVEFANQNQDGVHISDGVMAIGEVSRACSHKKSVKNHSQHDDREKN